MNYDVDRVASATIAALFIAMYVYQDGVQPCNDGRRYTSRRRQPSPFNRRFCGWDADFLKWATWMFLFLTATTLGEWWKALLFMSLPGVWFCATRPQTVDAVSMGLAWGAALELHHRPWLAVALALASGFVHERGPVFAALYAWHPLPLVGLCAVMWWRKAAPFDGDPYVGLPSLRATLLAQKKMQDYVDWKSWIYPTKVIVPLAATEHVPLNAWLALLVASATRIMGTDNTRFVMWGVPPVVAGLTSAPLWLVAAHAMFLVRMP